MSLVSLYLSNTIQELGYCRWGVVSCAHTHTLGNLGLAINELAAARKVRSLSAHSASVSIL